MEVVQARAAEAPTSIIDGNARPWLSFPGTNAQVKVLSVDEEQRIVVFMFRMVPNSYFARHRHHCQAIAFTVSGEWEYEDGKIPSGAMAYEPPGSDHTPASIPGADGLTVLISKDDRFLEFLDDDGNVTGVADLAFFKALQNMTPEQAAQLVAG